MISPFRKDFIFTKLRKYKTHTKISEFTAFKPEELTLCMLGNFFIFLVFPDFFLKLVFQEYHLSVKTNYNQVRLYTLFV